MKTNHIKSRIIRLVKQVNLINNMLADHFIQKNHSYEYHMKLRAKVCNMTNTIHELQNKYAS